jgi:radical SAM superfamily enzyme YgiQ (UPF0313 family)
VGEEIRRRKLNIYFSAFASMNNIRADDIAGLFESGLRALFFGIETGDAEYLKRVHNKNNMGTDFIVKVGSEAMKRGVFSSFSFIVPSPFETHHTRRMSLELIERLFAESKNGSVLAVPSFLGTGSVWWEKMEEYGFEFNPGYDKHTYLLSMLDWDSDFLLPRSLLQDLGYQLNRKTCYELFLECERFLKDVEKLGVQTNIDDAAYMIGLMGGVEPTRYKAEMMSNLIRGGSERMLSFVRGLNSAEAHG